MDLVKRLAENPLASTKRIGPEMRADKQAKETADKINQADSLIFQTEKQLKEYGDKLPADKKQPIEDALKKLKEETQINKLHITGISLGGGLAAISFIDINHFDL